MRNALRMMRLDTRSVNTRNNVLLIYLVTDLITVALAFSPLAEGAFLIGFGGLIGGSGACLITPFVASAQRGLDAFYAMLPVRRRDIVNGHYLFAAVLSLFMLMNTWLIVILIHWLRPTLFGADLPILLSFALVGPFMLLMMSSVQYPILMRISYEKAPYLIFLPIVAAGLVSGYIGGSSTDLLGRHGFFSPRGYPLLGLGLVGGAGIFLASLLLARRLYARRDL
ncbi:MAG: ABC-2 transporter permease [Schleiferilactobacillus harbinensis]|jgi:hypothetical protein|nr:ABC-2 transporter permease [Schleiferilactobacillus harbinensis]MCI1912895.1 ABC-2 transporter permease [Schleiferilactobacillus harbinensis]